ncbi:MAG TPA: putative cytokinetic ring protein SteA [Mycobacteriales bacterium]|nr:putative cytokinetic ring protein SteA [Mycobacteriales bacterium]
MRLATLRRGRTTALPGVTGAARLDRRTKNLTKRLRPGDVAVIDHVDLDRVSAEALVRAGAAAVVNAAPSISGRYPNLGPEILLAAGIPLLDNVGSGVFARLREGEPVRVHGGRLLRGEEVVATGDEQTADTIGAAMLEARAEMSVQLEAFVTNTMEYVRRERDLLFDGVGVPELRTRLEGRHCLIVVRGYDYQEDLASLRPYIREYRPVLVGVDGGADALREAGYQPDVVVGDMDSVSDAVLRSGAEIVVHAYPDGHAPGLKRVEDLDVPAVVFPAAGTSEDVAMLLADELGASLIVAVGSHATLVEFLDKGRAGMASTFLTRLRVGGKLVDAKGVSRLYRSRIKTGSLVWLIVAALATMAVALLLAPVTPTYGRLLADRWGDLTRWLGGLF